MKRASHAPQTISRRSALVLLPAMLSAAFVMPTSTASAEEVPSTPATSADDAALMSRFDYLSQNGNSNCSAEFMASIASMPATMIIQGSCCAPMDAHRYIEQVKTLRGYADLPEIPDDPYAIPAGLAQELLPYYDLALSGPDQAAYDYAMANADERGPCCCGCWRWHVYGGLGRKLIRERGFSGLQVVDVWNLSNGCGGGAEHRHG